MIRMSKQKFKYLENKKSFYAEIKCIIHHFKGLLGVKNHLRRKCAPLSLLTDTYFKLQTLTEFRTKFKQLIYSISPLMHSQQVT